MENHGVGIGSLEARFQLLNWNLLKGLFPYREPSRTWLHLHPKGTKHFSGSWETLLTHRPSVPPVSLSPESRVSRKVLRFKMQELHFLA